MLQFNLNFGKSFASTYVCQNMLKDLVHFLVTFVLWLGQCDVCGKCPVIVELCCWSFNFQFSWLCKRLLFCLLQCILHTYHVVYHRHVWLLLLSLFKLCCEWEYDLIWIGKNENYLVHYILLSLKFLESKCQKKSNYMLRSPSP